MSLLGAALGIVDLDKPLVDDQTDLDIKLGPDGGKLIMKIRPDGSIFYPETLNGLEIRKAANLAMKLEPGMVLAMMAISEIGRLKAEIRGLRTEIDDFRRKGR